jgi:hypothetical protein
LHIEITPTMLGIQRGTIVTFDDSTVPHKLLTLHIEITPTMLGIQRGTIVTFDDSTVPHKLLVVKNLANKNNSFILTGSERTGIIMYIWLILLPLICIPLGICVLCVCMPYSQKMKTDLVTKIHPQPKIKTN